MLENVDTHTLGTLITIFTSIVFYLQILHTIQYKDETMTRLTLLFTFTTLFTLYEEFQMLSKEIALNRYEYVIPIIFIVIDVIMSILLTLFIIQDFSKVATYKYVDHPYYKNMLYIAYIMLGANFIYLMYTSISIIQNYYIS